MSKKTSIICDHCGRPVLDAARIEVVYYRTPGFTTGKPKEEVDSTYDFCSNACAEDSLRAWQGGHR